MYDKGLWKNGLQLLPYFLMYHREIKGSETFLILILSEKGLIHLENITP